jgi:hypothetical protein
MHSAPAAPRSQAAATINATGSQSARRGNKRAPEEANLTGRFWIRCFRTLPSLDTFISLPSKISV